eukprot:CAMPEP_0197627942 /NCGR_PEP_ID=MMETSP1338-20131121/6411_1 /TAXON_ID=43686 ORGANISM="Pelagodinium beii, Strain RCC1491" /NCGR_SAMPLE_ID=MMETSP1338 /ASSEMBLY_ACC=CAM_ASM_000754 /LENGTH=190 /DNA_ID=CAMNT_0043198797 /DNA_START=81 /DNA_END=654 /DNA_ORIENTATION=+
MTSSWIPLLVLVLASPCVFASSLVRTQPKQPFPYPDRTSQVEPAALTHLVVDGTGASTELRASVKNYALEQNPGKVEIWGVGDCPHYLGAVHAAQEKGIPSVEAHPFANRPEFDTWLTQNAAQYGDSAKGHKESPFVVIDGKFIGGEVELALKLELQLKLCGEATQDEGSQTIITCNLQSQLHSCFDEAL